MKKILLIFLFCFISMSFYNAKTFTLHRNIETQDVSFLEGELNDSILYLALEHYNIKHPRIVLAQAKLETGNYTSRHCIKGNNLFGLYNSKKKKYFQFNHWSESIEAYKDMIEYKHKNGEDYYEFLIRIKYATSPNYIDLVKEIEKQIQIND